MHAVSNLLNGLDSNTIVDVCETYKYIFAAGEGAAPPPTLSPYACGRVSFEGTFCRETVAIRRDVGVDKSQDGVG